MICAIQIASQMRPVKKPNAQRHTPAAVLAIKARREHLQRLRVRHHLAPDWRDRFAQDHGFRPPLHLVPAWQLMPYCDA